MHRVERVGDRGEQQPGPGVGHYDGASHGLGKLASGESGEIRSAHIVALVGQVDGVYLVAQRGELVDEQILAGRCLRGAVHEHIVDHGRPSFVVIF